MRSPTRTAGLALSAAAAFALVAAPASRAYAAPALEASTGEVVASFADLMARLFVLGVMLDSTDNARPPPADESKAAMQQEGYAQRDGWDSPRRRRTRDSREGFLFSFGLGGGSMLVSPLGRAGAFQGNLRLGYGFSDRFQMFIDLTGAGVNYGAANNGPDSATSWVATIRGQTVLIGDRRGNGLNLNAGIGLGGVTKTYSGVDVTDRTGLALAGGISYDARLTRTFSLSPEFFVWWHAIPNDRGRPNDVASALGMQLNFLWYGP